MVCATLGIVHQVIGHTKGRQMGLYSVWLSHDPELYALVKCSLVGTTVVFIHAACCCIWAAERGRMLDLPAGSRAAVTEGRSCSTAESTVICPRPATCCEAAGSSFSICSKTDGPKTSRNTSQSFLPFLTLWTPNLRGESGQRQVVPCNLLGVCAYHSGLCPLHARLQPPCLLLCHRWPPLRCLQDLQAGSVQRLPGARRIPAAPRRRAGGWWCRRQG